MVPLLEHLEKIFAFVLQETTAKDMVNILYEKVKRMAESFIMLRDIENFIAYFKLVLSTSHIPKKLQFAPNLTRAFIERTYTGFTNSAQDFRANRLYEYLKDKLPDGAEISSDNLEQLEDFLVNERKPTLENIMEHAQIAMILKWLQGPIKNELSQELQDYIISLATAYGQCQRSLVLNVELNPFEVLQQDLATITKEYKSFENSLNESLKAVKDARAQHPDTGKYQEQFKIVISSLDNLVKMSEKGRLDTINSFKDKIIVSTALIYIQDEFVKKDPQLKKFIQLFVSLYYQFRDKRPDVEKK